MKSTLFTTRLSLRIGEDFKHRSFEVSELSQDELKERLIEKGEEGQFPMICFEHTNDSNIEVGIDESKFLNDEAHDGHWMVFSDETGSDSFILCFNEFTGIRRLEIDTMEVSMSERRNGLGRQIINTIIDCACYQFDEIILSPFDTDAMNFWETMGFEKDINYNYIYRFE